MGVGRASQEQGRGLGDMRGVDLYVPPAFRVSGKEAAALAAEATALEQGRDPPSQVGVLLGSRRTAGQNSSSK